MGKLSGAAATVNGRPHSLPVSAGPGFDLWLIDLRFQSSPETRAWLSDAERRKAARFVFERDRRRYLAAHIALRNLLSHRTKIAPAQLEFSEGPFGKPALRSTAACNFNLSHSEDVAVLLIAEQGEIGVDVEMLRPMADASSLAQRNFSRDECARFHDVESTQRDLAFLTGWTRKEACLKAIGSGLSIAPDLFTAGLEHAERTTTIPTPTGTATVTVNSFCHEQRLIVAWASVASLPTG